MNCVVFASGRGSNFEALCKAKRAIVRAWDLKLLVSNVPTAGAIKVAGDFQVPVVVVPHTSMTRQAHEEKILAELVGSGVDLKTVWLVLAGYMRVFTKEFLAHFYDNRLKQYRVVNIHPSLLPAFPGVDGYKQALDAGVTKTGCTVHLVIPEIDAGPVILQKEFAILKTDRLEDVERKGLALEHVAYAEALDELARNEYT